MSDDSTRRQFLGAAAAVATLGASTSTATAEPEDWEADVDGPTRRYGDYEYGERTVTDRGVGTLDMSIYMEGAGVAVNRCSDAVELRVSLPTGELLLDLTADESAAFREELRRAEAGVVAHQEGDRGDL